MPKPKKPETWDVAEYSRENEPKDKYATIYEIIQYMPREFADKGITVKLQSNYVKLTYQAYEMHLNHRLKEVQEDAKLYMNEIIKYLKKEFKERRGETLDMKEIKEFADDRIEKAGLNSRWMYLSWKAFEVKEDDDTRASIKGQEFPGFNGPKWV